MSEHQRQGEYQPEGESASDTGSQVGAQEAAFAGQQTEGVSQELEELRALLQRTQADFINYKKRAEQEREDILKFMNAGLIGRLLPVLDDMAMALEQAPPSQADNGWAEGVRLINRKLHAILESEGVTLIEAEGKPFDPVEHDALGFQESSQCPEGHVVAVARTGYKLAGRVLRPAQVIIARASSPSSRE